MNTNGIGANPIARRDCERPTTSEKCTKSHGTEPSTRMISVPPSANTAHRRGIANATSGKRINAATETAPLRPKTSGATRKSRGPWITSCSWYWTIPRISSPGFGLWEIVWSTIGFSHSSTSPVGTAAISQFRHSQRNNASSGISRKIEYVGCESEIARKIATSVAQPARVRAVKKIAIAAGTNICRVEVAGSVKTTYDPPCAGPKTNSASVATRNETPATRLPNTATPASHVTAHAIGVSTAGA